MRPDEERGYIEEVAARFAEGDEEDRSRLADAVQRSLDYRRRRRGKDCRRCGMTRPLGAFTPRADYPDGLDPICRLCHREGRTT